MWETETKRLKDDLLKCQGRLLAIRADLKFRRFMFALKEGFNPDQPRDDDGRWTTGDGQILDDGQILGDGQILEVAARGNEALCEAQYARDKITCNLVRTALCWSQAMERYSACLVGRPIPQLRF